MTNKTTKLLLTGVAASVIGYGVAKADDFNFTAAIDILEALKVVETQKMDFGVIERPNSPVTVIVTRGGAVDGATTAAHIDTSTVQQGKYKVSGSSLKTIAIQASDGGSVPGLGFASLDGSYNGESNGELIGAGLSGLSAPTQAGKDLDIGGSLTVDPSVEEGTYAPDFNLTVNYE